MSNHTGLTLGALCLAHKAAACHISAAEVYFELSVMINTEQCDYVILNISFERRKPHFASKSMQDRLWQSKRRPTGKGHRSVLEEPLSIQKVPHSIPYISS